MKWGLLRRGEYPEVIARELEQLTEAIRSSFLVSHDAEGHPRRCIGRWNLAETQATATATATRIVCTRPDPDNVTPDVVMGTDGILTVLAPGDYHVLGQVRFAPNGTGVRAVQLYRRGVLIAQTVRSGFASSDAVGQVMETLPCAAGDTFELVGVQTSGGALNVAFDNGMTRQETFLRIARVA